MGLFSKRKAVSQPPIGDGYSVLDAHLTIVGDIETDGTLRIDGRLEGSVRRGGIVILGIGATIQGSVAAREVVVGGTVQGDIRAGDRVELQPTAIVTGDVEAGTVLIQEGGVLRGRLFVRPASSDTMPAQAALPPGPSEKRIPSITPAASLRIAPPAASTAS